MSDYWKTFYKKKHTLEPSSFAKFVRKFIKDKNLIAWDFGCGNGRDTYYLGKKWRITTGVDVSIKPKNKINRRINHETVFILSDVVGERSDLSDCVAKNSLIYMRFFVHCINDEIFIKILNNKAKYIAIEVRSDKDNPKLYPDHPRYLRSGQQLIDMIHSVGYELIYFIESAGLAKYKNEDPIIIRIIAKQKDV